MRINKSISLVLAVLIGTALISCNSNDDFGTQEIEIPGITLDGDLECCSAEEALAVYNFLQTVKLIPELTLNIADQYLVSVYSPTGRLHTGYNDLYFVATKKKNGNYVKDFSIPTLTPLMYMSKMNMYHSTPVSAGAKLFDYTYLAVRKGWVSFLMNTSENGSWTFSYDATVLSTEGSIQNATITVDALPEGQQWLKNFKVGEQTYFLSLVNPTDWQTGKNTITAYVSQKSQPITTPYALSQEQFTIEIDPRMPDMGNHTSPDNVALTKQADGSYQGTVNLTMTGRWRIHLTVKDAQGNVVAGGDDLTDGYSSLYWEVTI